MKKRKDGLGKGWDLLEFVLDEISFVDVFEVT